MRGVHRFSFVALVVAALLAGSAGAARSSLPTIYVNYNAANCTFAVTNDAGTGFTQIVPGNYEVLISTHDPYGLAGGTPGTLPNCGGYVQFSLIGPGVSLMTTLDYGDEASELDTETFTASGSYTMDDANNPSASRFTFTTAATGTAQSVAGPGSSSSSSKSSGSSNPNTPIGAGLSTAVRATLAASVSSSGKLTLDKGGKKVVSLTSGRYKFAVSDKSKKAGFSLQSLTGKKTAITSASFVGTHSVTIALAPGHWSFFTPGGAKTTFFVLS